MSHYQIPNLLIFRQSRDVIQLDDGTDSKCDTRVEEILLRIKIMHPTVRVFLKDNYCFNTQIDFTNS